MTVIIHNVCILVMTLCDISNFATNVHNFGFRCDCEKTDDVGSATRLLMEHPPPATLRPTLGFRVLVVRPTGIVEIPPTTVTGKCAKNFFE